MNWTSKAACVVVFSTSLLLILAMGRSNKRHFEKVHESIEEIYQDRLVVSGIIFELSNILHRKELVLVTSNEGNWTELQKSVDSDVDELIKRFKDTYLTEREEITLRSFERSIEELRTLEKGTTFDSNGKMDAGALERRQAKLNSLKEGLETLSAIQLSEGRRKLTSSSEAIETMNVHQSIEEYSMLLIGLLILVVLLLPPPRSSTEQREEGH